MSIFFNPSFLRQVWRGHSGTKAYTNFWQQYASLVREFWLIICYLQATVVPAKEQGLRPLPAVEAWHWHEDIRFKQVLESLLGVCGAVRLV